VPPHPGRSRSSSTRSSFESLRTIATAPSRFLAADPDVAHYGTHDGAEHLVHERMTVDDQNVPDIDIPLLFQNSQDEDSVSLISSTCSVAVAPAIDLPIPTRTASARGG
jgi:hypothetical protein